jgi:hypothetical protein
MSECVRQADHDLTIPHGSHPTGAHTSLTGKISVDRPEALEYLQGRLGRGIQTRRESLPLEQRCWGIV